LLLMDEQISALNERIDDFLAAGPKVRDEIIGDFIRSFENAHPPDADDFDGFAVEIVSALSATLGCSHRFLAHSPAPLRRQEDQTGNQKISSPNPKSESYRIVRTSFNH
jgi:hypothetical protein